MRLGFLGRRSVYEVVRRVIFDIALFEKGDVTIVDAAYREKGEIVLSCTEYRCTARELFISLPKILGGGRLGVDLGASKNGMAYVWRGIPLLRAVLDWDTVGEILRESRDLEIHMGSSPYVDVKRAASLLGCKEVRLIDELTASQSRPWLARKFPGLQEDEIDALSFTLYDGVTATIC